MTLGHILVGGIVHVGDRVLRRTVGGVPDVAVCHPVFKDIVASVRVIGRHKRTHHKHVVDSVPVYALRSEGSCGFLVAVVKGLADLQHIQRTFFEDCVLRVHPEVIAVKVRNG